MSATTFPLFKELPAELQTMIWEMSLEKEDWTASRLDHFCYGTVRHKGSSWCHTFTGSRRDKVVYYGGHFCVLKDVCRSSRFAVLRKWLRELKTLPPLLFRMDMDEGRNEVIGILEQLGKEWRRVAIPSIAAAH